MMLKISVIQIFNALEYTFHGNKWNLGTFSVLKRVAGFECRGKGVGLGMTVKLDLDVSQVALGDFLVRNFCYKKKKLCQGFF